MARWIEPDRTDIPQSVLAVVGGDPLVASIVAKRGYTTAETAAAFLDSRRYRPTPASELPDLSMAVARIEEAIRHREILAIWGDFDVDGLTSTALLVEALRELGARVEFYIPDRLTESHGIHLPPLQRLISRGVRVLITCDTGTTDLAAIAYARGQGLDVIVTDHHDLGPEWPRANALVNPKRLPADHPLAGLSGVGCAYKLIEELWARRGDDARAEKALDLVALGLVADIAPLVADVRYLVQRGLEVLQRNERLGLKALLEVADIRAEGISEEQIAFGLAPRLNALGRLAEATAAVELFTTKDIIRARTIATEMEALNVERQLLCSQVMDAALSMVERDRRLLDSAALVLEHPKWPAGVLGIVASRLVERYNRPVIILTHGEDGLARGSARSVPHVDIRAAIAAQAHLLERFGGHPMAAGLSLAISNVAAFREALNDTVRQMARESRAEPTLEIAAYVPLSQITLDLVARVERLAPFGVGNPPPYFAARGLRVTSYNTMGRTGEHRRIVVEDKAGEHATVFWWHGLDSPLPGGPFDLAYTIRSRDYLGRPEIQIEWIDARLEPGTTVELRPKVQKVQAIDWRTAPNPIALLHELLATEESVTVWGEAIPAGELPLQSREMLREASTLIVWTIPPGPAELAHALTRSGAKRVHLFAIEAGLDEPRAFLSRLAGLLKHDLSEHGGQVHLPTLAAALGHREATVRSGIEWLVARGQIRILNEGLATLQIAAGDRRVRSEAESAYQELQALLTETTAYRAHFRRVSPDSLLPQEGEKL